MFLIETFIIIIIIIIIHLFLGLLYKIESRPLAELFRNPTDYELVFQCLDLKHHLLYSLQFIFTLQQKVF